MAPRPKRRAAYSGGMVITTGMTGLYIALLPVGVVIFCVVAFLIGAVRRQHSGLDVGDDPPPR